MADIAGAVGRLVRIMKGGLRGSDAPGPGTEVATGAAAVRAVETTLGAVLDDAAGRSGCARALGRAAGGLRSAAFLGGTEAPDAAGLLRQAADRRIPLVVHLDPGNGGDRPSGTGHEAFHTVGSAGFTLVASDVQEAADFTWIARRVAETMLLPGVVAMDPGTARGVQDFEPLDHDRGIAFAGSADAVRPADTAAQELTFGRHRRAVPRRVDPERPLTTGIPLDGAAHAAAVAGRHVYYDAHLPARLQETFDAFAEMTGRTHRRVTAHRLDDARIVLVAMGSAVGTAEAVADRLRSQGRRIGVLGIRVLHPFPATEIMGLLRGKEHVLVLERTAGPASGEPPLTRELRAVLGLAREYSQYRSRSLRDLIPQNEKGTPRLAAVLYGMGGAPLRAGDLFSLCRDLPTSWRSPVQLGIDVLPGSEGHPKRRAHLDALRRAYPEAETYGFRALPEDVLRLEPEDAVSTVVARPAHTGTAWSADAVGLLHRMFGGRVRTRPGASHRRDCGVVFDRLVHAASPVRDIGDAAPADIVAWLPTADPNGVAFIDAVSRSRTLLLARRSDRGSVAHALPAAVRRRVAAGDLRLYMIQEKSEATGALRAERLLGGLLGVFLGETLRDVNPRKALAARQEMLAGTPDADARLVAFQSGLDGVMRVEAGSWSRVEDGEDDPVTAPERARSLPEGSSPLESPSRLWDQAAVFHREGNPDAIAPDPVLATGSLPPLTAALGGCAESRSTLPAFEPDACTGCGTCWSVCPTGAIVARAATGAALVDVGTRLVRERGGSADALKPVATKLGQRIADAARDAAFAGGPADALVRAGRDALLDTSKLPEERRAAVSAAADALAAAWGDLPVARTAVLFDDPDAAKKGSGALLTLAVDPESCTACGLCVRECEPDALVSRVQDPATLRDAAAAMARVGSLPAPGPALLETMAVHPEAGLLAARMLEAPGSTLPGGAAGSEPAPGALIALRQVLAAGRPGFMSDLNERLESLAELKDKLSELVRDAMAGALPGDDLAALAAGLDTAGSSHLDLGSLMGRVEGAVEGKRVDTSRLRRMVTIARDVGEVAERASRASKTPAAGRASVVIDSRGAEWIGTFPFNPFPDATYVTDGAGAVEVALGVGDAHAAAAAVDARALRRARLVLDGSPQALREADRMPDLAWEDLTDDERRLVPPVILVGSDRVRDGEGRGRLTAALGAGRPLVVVLLADGFSGGIPFSEPGAWIAAAAGFPRVRVAQVTPAVPGHLAEAAGWVLDGNAGVLRVFAPSPQRAGFDPDRLLDRAREALAARVFPVFRMHHDAREGLSVDLAGNPAPDDDWVVDDAGEAFTPARWGLGERRFAAWFRRPDTGGPAPTPLLDHIGVSPAERGEGTASILDPQGAPWIVADPVVRWTEDTAEAWTLLRRFHRAVRVETRAAGDDEALDRLRRQHEAELARIRAEYEHRMAGLKNEFRSEMAGRVRNRLLALLNRAGGNGKGGA